MLTPCNVILSYYDLKAIETRPTLHRKASSLMLRPSRLTKEKRENVALNARISQEATHKKEKFNECGITQAQAQTKINKQRAAC